MSVICLSMSVTTSMAMSVTYHMSVAPHVLLSSSQQVVPWCSIAGVLRCGKRGGSSLHDGADDGGRDFYTGFQYKIFVWRIPTASLHTHMFVSWYNTALGVWKMKFEIRIGSKTSSLLFFLIFCFFVLVYQDFFNSRSTCLFLDGAYLIV